MVENEILKISHMKAVSFFVWLSLCLLVACAPSDTECAQALVTEAHQLVDSGHWRQARLVLDSLHTVYPKEIAQRRMAKALEDSIVYLEAQSTIAYTDTVLPPLLEKADALIKQFRYEKDEKYEDYGRYVHRLLATGSNTSRNFLQVYVRDDRKTIVKSYYFGSYPVQQQSITIASNGEEVRFLGSNHSFELEGWHEIMTMEDELALQLLNFVSSHINDRIRVSGQGVKTTHTWVYYLNDKEKQALSDTYQLGWLMKDIKRLEEIQHTAHRQVERYLQKY